MEGGNSGAGRVPNASRIILQSVLHKKVSLIDTKRRPQLCREARERPTVATNFYNLSYAALPIVCKENSIFSNHIRTFCRKFCSFMYRNLPIQKNQFYLQRFAPRFPQGAIYDALVNPLDPREAPSGAYTASTWTGPT